MLVGRVSAHKVDADCRGSLPPSGFHDGVTRYDPQQQAAALRVRVCVRRTRSSG